MSLFIYIKIKEPQEVKNELKGISLLMIPKETDGSINKTKLGKYIDIVEPSIKHRKVVQGYEELKGYNSGVLVVGLKESKDLVGYQQKFKEEVSEGKLERIMYVVSNKSGRALERELGEIVKIIHETDRVSEGLIEVVIVVEKRGKKEKDIDRMIKLLGIKFWKVAKESENYGKR